MPSSTANDNTGSTTSKTSKKRHLKYKPVLDEETLIQDFEAHGINLKHASKIWRYLIQHSAEAYHDIPEIPKEAIKLLESEYTNPITSKVVKRSDAADGSTTKLMIELQDGLCVESVIMRYGHVDLDCFPEEEKNKKQQQLSSASACSEDGGRKFRSNKRATLCVSSQVGCAMGCTFCATGTMGLMANLTAGEILEQLYHASKIEKIRGIVFMGMGEPLDNYSAVLHAIKGMTDTARFGIAAPRISISTVGVVPRMVSMIKDAPEVGLALSLHAPTQELRTQIVPTAKAWNIHKIIAASDQFIDNQNAKRPSRNRKRHVLIEYVLISQVNDTEEVAHQLGELLQGRQVLLNLIPYNPTVVPYNYKSPTEEAKKKFVDIVRNQYGVHTLLRQTMGQDIDGACGQLVIKNTSQGNGCQNENDDILDMEDILSTKSSSKHVASVKSTVKSLISRKSTSGNSSSSIVIQKYIRSQQHWVVPSLILLLLSVLIAKMYFT